ncbi:MAG: CBS domain-containing protein [Gallionellaceae bacterium]
MPISEICNRETIIVRRDSTAVEAARLMRQHHVGDVLVVEYGNDGARIPVGIVTDRDLVVEILAPGLDPETITAGDIMAPGLVTVKEGTGVFETIQYMRAKGVRRLPVVDEKNALVGIVTLDDLLELLSEELLALAKLVRQEQKKEIINRR